MDGYSDDAFSEASEEITVLSVGSGPRPPSKPKNSRTIARRSSKIVSPYGPPTRPSAPLPPKTGPAFLRRTAGPTFGSVAGKSAREHWLSSLRGDKGPGLSSERRKADTWKEGRPKSAVIATGATSYLQDLLMSKGGVMGQSLKRTRTRSVTGISADAQSGFKSPEDMYDEIQRLKKLIQTQTESKSQFVTKVRRQEEELRKKDKQIDDMLNSGQLSNSDFTRTLTQKKSDSSSAVMALKQQVHGLERALREKESLYDKLIKDIKTTNIQELEIQTETYYTEVLRLKKELKDSRESSVENVSLKGASRETRVKVKALNAAVLRLTENCKQLEEDNTHLKEDLGRRRSPKMKGFVADKYADYNRSQMVARLEELETETETYKGSLERSSREASVADSDHQESVKKFEGSQSELQQRISGLEEAQESLTAERDKLRNVIRKLKEDRAYYRTKAETSDVDLKEVRSRLKSTLEERDYLDEEVMGLKRKQSDEEVARNHSATLRKRHFSGELKGREEQNVAAAKLQNQWRKHKSKKRQETFENEYTEAAVEVQSIFRGHMRRKRQLADMTEDTRAYSDEEMDEAAVQIQSAVRGHLTRKEALSKTSEVHKWATNDKDRVQWNSLGDADDAVSFKEEFLGSEVGAPDLASVPPVSASSKLAPRIKTTLGQKANARVPRKMQRTLESDDEDRQDQNRSSKKPLLDEIW